MKNHKLKQQEIQKYNYPKIWGSKHKVISNCSDQINKFLPPHSTHYDWLDGHCMRCNKVKNFTFQTTNPYFIAANGSTKKKKRNIIYITQKKKERRNKTFEVNTSAGQYTNIVIKWHLTSKKYWNINVR